MIVGSTQVEVRPETSGFADDLKSKIGDALKNPLVIAGAAVAAAGTAVGAFAKSSIDKFASVGSEVKQLSAATGQSAESMSHLRFVGQETGVSNDVLAVSLKKLSLATATHGGALDSLGIKYKDAHGAALPMDAVLGNVSEKFVKLPNQAAKNALAIQLFGKSGTDLIPILNKGKDGIAALGKESDKYGLTLTQNNLVALQKSKEAHRELNAAMSGLQVQLGAQLFPILASVTQFFASQAIPVILDMTGAVKDKLGPVLDGISTGLETFVTSFENSTTATTILHGVISTFTTDAKTLFDDLTIAYGSFIDGFKSNDAVGAEAGVLATAFAAVGVVVRDALSAVGDFIGFLLDHKTATKDVAEGVLAFVAAYKLIQFGKKTIDIAVNGAENALSIIGKIADKLAGIGGKTIDVAAKGIGQQAAGGAANAAGSGAVATIGEGAAGGALGDALDLKNIVPKLKALGSAVKFIIPEIVIGGLAAIGEFIAGATFLVPALVIAAVAGAAALIYHFREPLENFCTSTLPDLFVSGIEGLSSLGSTLETAGRDLINSIGDGIATGAQAVLQFFIDLPMNAAYGLGFAVGTLVKVGIDIIGFIVSGIVVTAQEIWDFFTNLGPTIVGFLGDVGTTLLDTGSRLLGGLWSGIKTVWDNEVHFWTDIVPSVLGFLGDTALSLVSKGGDFLRGLYHGVQDAWNDPAGFFKAIPGAVVGFLGDVGSTLLGAGSSLIGGLSRGVTAGFSAVTHFFGGVKNSVLGAIGDAGSWLLDVGGQVIGGLISGLRNGLQSVLNVIKGLAGSVEKGFKDALGIKSPSTVFHDAGINIGEGLINGINSIAPKVLGATNALVTIPAIPSSIGGGSSSPVGHTFNLHFNNYSPDVSAKTLMAQFQDMQRLAVPIH